MVSCTISVSGDLGVLWSFVLLLLVVYAVCVCVCVCVCVSGERGEWGIALRPTGIIFKATSTVSHI